MRTMGLGMAGRRDDEKGMTVTHDGRCGNHDGVLDAFGVLGCLDMGCDVQ